MKNNILNGIFGVAVGDALGVPVEFESRETLRDHPVVDMRSFGTFHLPAGTWSDDTSMTLCLMDSLSKGLDYNDIMEKFLSWIQTGAYTPFEVAFDIGTGTSKAVRRFARGTSALECGGITERDNGNGSLMRILPILFYLTPIYGADITKHEEAMTIIHQVSALTHAHKRSLIACGIYISVASMILESGSLQTGIDLGVSKALDYYQNHDAFAKELHHYHRLREADFSQLPVTEIRSSGYVVDTLEAAIWCLLNTASYKDCVLKAVNLGEDTDTVAAVAGGLAGLHYGVESIPEEWLSVIAKRDFIIQLCNRFES